jgi:GNAT superfamily N-acetyltransferase
VGKPTESSNLSASAMSLKLEPLSKENLKEALELAQKLFPDYIDRIEKVYEVSLEKNMVDPYWKTRRILEYWVGVDTISGKIVVITGFYQKTEHDADEIWLGWFGVNPEIRGRGIGRQTLEWSINTARERGYKFLRLWTTTDPEEAIAQKLYDSVGLSVYKEELDKNGDTILYRELKLS